LSQSYAASTPHTTRLYVDETTAPVLDPGRGKTKTGYLWAVLRDDRGWNGSARSGVVFHYRPGRKGEYAAEILEGFNGTIQVDAYGGYSHLATSDRGALPSYEDNPCHFTDLPSPAPEPFRRAVTTQGSRQWGWKKAQHVDR
jgi:hypothetical protein